MANIKKCRICHGEIDIDKEKDWILPSKGYYYHKFCYESFAKKKGAIKEGDMSVELEDDLWKAAIYEYFKKDLKISLNYVKFLNQWNSYLKKNMTAKGIYFAVRYFYEVQKGDVSKSEGGIGIIPFIYNESAEYWCNRNERDKGICDRIEAQIRQMRNQKIKIVLQKNQPRTPMSINWTEIEEMGDDEE